MSAAEFIEATKFVAIVALIIAFFGSGDQRIYRLALALAALWLVAVCVIVAVQ